MPRRETGAVEARKYGLRARKAVVVAPSIGSGLLSLEEESDVEAEEAATDERYLQILSSGAATPTSSHGPKEVPMLLGTFAFKTSSKKNKLAEVATELARTPRSGTSLHRAPAEKPTPTQRSPALHRKPKKASLHGVASTPYRLRKRLKEVQSDSESELSESVSEEEDSHSEEETVKGRGGAEANRTHKLTPARKRGKRGARITQEVVEDYFDAHKTSKVITSDRTLSKLQSPRLDQETLGRLLRAVQLPFREERKQLEREYRGLFAKWMTQLRLGFNVLLYGLGSKRNLLEEFRCALLPNRCHVVINGYFPSITIKMVLNSIISEVLEDGIGIRNPMEQLAHICSRFRQDSSLELYLVIHNIDGEMLRAERSQRVLGQLASLPNVHLIASVDHINGPLIWEQSKVGWFNWLWCEVTTYEPYAEETSYENSLLVQQSDSLALSSLTHVLRSLTPNARGIFQLLVEHEIDNKNNPSNPGLSFQDFYERCRVAFLVNSDLTLRAQLTEFRDHKLIRTKKGADGVEYLSIPIDASTLGSFMENQDLDS
ncbi:origin recognition complex subunit 2 [Lethenteron reissneri]|uniref:origin recognition complex subunit 2 n=1 Tax=Lethenteron reissneri TaxID=7753 RepID=UPI002AB6DCCC|nr:origin recognition complex subunit 2 [Lethenteron reissneri]